MYDFNTPPVVKNLLIINVLLFVMTYVFQYMNIDLVDTLGLHLVQSELFSPYQFVSHMFMHGSIMHIVFNMYSLWMFGKILEMSWGGKRFLFYYFVTGLGAAFLHSAIGWYEMHTLAQQAAAFHTTPTPELLQTFLKTNVPEIFSNSAATGAKQQIIDFITEWSLHPENKAYIESANGIVDSLVGEIRNVPTVGASGAVFGLLLAFGMMYPNVELQLMFIPVPIKAKFFVIGFGLIELFGGLQKTAGDNIAHFAHLGGMIFGFILIKIWWNKRNTYNNKFFN